MPVKAVPLAAAATTTATTAAAATSFATYATYASAGASALGAMGSFIGQGGQGKAQAAAAEYNAKIAARNAKAAKQKAEWRTLVNKMSNIEFREDFRREVIAPAIVAYNKAGVVADSGTARLVMEESAREADEEIARRTMVASVEAGEFEEQATNFRLNANLQRLYARQYRTASKFNAASTLVQGLSKAGSLLAQA